MDVSGLSTAVLARERLCHSSLIINKLWQNFSQTARPCSFVNLDVQQIITTSSQLFDSRNSDSFEYSTTDPDDLLLYLKLTVVLCYFKGSFDTSQSIHDVEEVLVLSSLKEARSKLVILMQSNLLESTLSTRKLDTFLEVMFVIFETLCSFRNILEHFPMILNEIIQMLTALSTLVSRTGLHNINIKKVRNHFYYLYVRLYNVID